MQNEHFRSRFSFFEGMGVYAESEFERRNVKDEGRDRLIGIMELSKGKISD